MVKKIDTIIMENIKKLTEEPNIKYLNKGNHAEYIIDTKYNFSILIQHEFLDNWFCFNISYDKGATYIRVDDNKKYNKKLSGFLRKKYGFFKSFRQLGNEEGIIEFIFNYVEKNLDFIQRQYEFIEYLEKIRHCPNPKYY